MGVCELPPISGSGRLRSSTPIVQGHKALAYRIRQSSKGVKPASVIQSRKERKATSAYRDRVGQRAVEALTWRRRHHDVIVTSSVVSVVIGAPDHRGFFGGSSVVPWSAMGFGPLSAQRIYGGRASSMTREGSGGSRCSGGPGLIGGIGDVGHVGGRSPLVVVEVVK